LKKIRACAWAYFFAQRQRSASERNFSAQDFHNISSDANVNHSVIHTRRAHKNPAGAQHFNSLFDEHAFVGLGDTVGHHPGGGAAGGGTSGRVFATVEQHASVQAGGAIDGLASHEIKKLAAPGLL
jgi:hypothetical protein